MTESVLIAKHGFAEVTYNHYADLTAGKQYAILDELPPDKHTDYQYKYILIRNDRGYTSFYSIENFTLIDYKPKIFYNEPKQTEK